MLADEHGETRDEREEQEESLGSWFGDVVEDEDAPHAVVAEVVALQAASDNIVELEEELVFDMGVDINDVKNLTRNAFSQLLDNLGLKMEELL